MTIAPDAAGPRSAATTLRSAVERAPGAADRAPEFSPDGGVTLFSGAGRSARLEPLGRRVRVSLSDRDGLVAEAEVDGLALIASIVLDDCAYHAAAGALGHENGPRLR